MELMKNKNSNSARRAFPLIAILVAVLACIATFLLGITRGLVQTGVFNVANPDGLTRWIYISLGVIVLGIAVYLMLEPDKVRRFLTGRQARYGSNSLIMSLAFLGILIVGNLIAFNNPVNIADLTEDQSNTLSPELLDALKTLPENVTAIGFFSQNMDTTSAIQLLDNIKSNSNGNFEYQFIDPDRDPQTAIQAGITGDGKILLQMGEYEEIVAFASEEEILNGLLRLLNPGANAIYFLTGHGEHDIEQGGDASMTRASATLQTKNYSVKTLNLLAENKIPDDASVIIIAGPQIPVSENEVKLLKDYLANGGSLIVLENPRAFTQFGEDSDPLADMLETDWGITFTNDVVIDVNSPDPTIAISAIYDSAHPISRNMNRVGVLFPFTQSLRLGEAPEGISTTNLVQTNEKSWGETDLQSLTQAGWPPSYDETTEAQGPLTLVAAGENTTSKGRVVVFGTSQVSMDTIFDSYGNGDMFINSVDWSADQENLVNLTPKTPKERTFNLPGQFQWIAIVLGSVIIIPGLVILAGISAWFTRRRQG